MANRCTVSLKSFSSRVMLRSRVEFHVEAVVLINNRT